MARIRTIKPQFWFDEDLGSVPREARLLYIGLWNMSDDQGVFEWRPMQIKAQIFPYDSDITPADIAKWMSELEKIGNLKPFENGGHKFGYIPTFLKHQEIKNPSKWHFAEIPEALLLPTPALPQQGVSPTPALPVGNREKEKEKEGIGNRVTGESKPIKQKFGEFLNVFLTPQEYQKLLDKFGKDDTAKRIETLSSYKKSKGVSYKDDYATILNWSRRDNANTQGSTGEPEKHDLHAGLGGPGGHIHRPGV